MRKAKGFSLIELLIVVAIILIIAALSIPNLIRSKLAANESSAVASIRVITNAQTSYNATYPDIGYASTLSVLGPPSGSDCSSTTAASSASACLVDSVLESGTKSGYLFSVSAGTTTPSVIYTTNGDPIAPGSSGQRHFYSDATGVIRSNQNTTATSADKPIQ